MNDEIDYSKYECPYSHLYKDCGHELHSPIGYEDIFSVWCECGFRAPKLYFDPEVLGLKLKSTTNIATVITDNKIIGYINDKETIVFTKLLNYYQPEIVDKTADVEILEKLLVRIMQIISQI